MRWHRLAGYGVLGAVLFRVAWGFIGGQTARFRSFVRGPAATFRYLRKLLGAARNDMPTPVGHNPLGALSILLMLVLLLMQTASGLFAVNVDGIASGPLAQWVSFRTGRGFAHWHAAIFHLLLAVIGLHLAAIAFYRLARKEKLVAPMIHGFKRRAPSGEIPYFVPWWRALILAAGVFLCVALLANLR